MKFAELNIHIKELAKTYKRFGSVRIYREALNILRNETLADDFMLSEYGGYTKGQLNYVKYQLNYHQNIKA